MASFRMPGPAGTSPQGAGTVDAGTLCVARSPRPGTIRHGVGVSGLPLSDRFASVLRRTVPYLPSEMREEFAGILSPASMAIITGTLALWAGSHYVGVGFVADLLLVVAGVAFLGAQIWSVAGDLTRAIQLTVNAASDEDLDQAARCMANFVAVVGVAAFIALLTKGAKAGAARVSTNLLTEQMLMKVLGSTKNVGTQVRANVRVVVEFMIDAAERSGRPQRPEDLAKAIADAMRGIDLHAAAPVKVEILTAGTRLTQRVIGNVTAETLQDGTSGVGRWFSVRGVSDRNLGVAEGARKYHVFTLTSDVKVLRSKAAAIADTWTSGRTPDVQVPRRDPKMLRTDAKGIREDRSPMVGGELVSGGGVQYYIPEGASIVKLPD
jgi:hypothetical protein